MKELEKLKSEIMKLEDQAKANLSKPHDKTPFNDMLENTQRGKFIAYGHVISLIDNILNKKQP